MKGFSIVEIIVVLLLIAVLAILAVTFSNPSLYYADQQANAVMDVLKEAKQRALTQKETMRVEINATDRMIRIIEENSPSDSSDDVEILNRPIGNESEVIFDILPDNVDYLPDEPTPVPFIEFKPSVHPNSSTKIVATLRFTKSGNVLNAGFDGDGNGAVILGTTLMFWMPEDNTDPNIHRKAKLLRGITVLGTSGAMKYWKCPLVDERCVEWIH